MSLNDEEGKNEQEDRMRNRRTFPKVPCLVLSSLFIDTSLVRREVDKKYILGC